VSKIIGSTNTAPTLIMRSATYRGIKGKNRKQKKYTPIAALEVFSSRPPQFDDAAWPAIAT
jgi:hypothetical protein